MKALIIGYGSIAKKHIVALKSIDPEIELFALRSSKNSIDIPGIVSLYNFGDIPSIDFCIISNPTQMHYETIDKVIELNVPIFIEKPSLMTMDGTSDLLEKIQRNNIKTFVGYVFRFHPGLKFLKNYIIDKRIIEVNIYCGSYLPSWRQGVDYREVYSAIKELGGGVQFDLSHEIDYALWLFGQPDEIIKTTKKISDLEINSCDFASYQFIYSDKIVNISLNYFRRKTKRNMEIVLEDETVILDFLSNSIKSEENGEIYNEKFEFLKLYEYQMKHFYNIILGHEESINTFEDSLEVVKCL